MISLTSHENIFRILRDLISKITHLLLSIIIFWPISTNHIVLHFYVRSLHWHIHVQLTCVYVRSAG